MATATPSIYRMVVSSRKRDILALLDEGVTSQAGLADELGINRATVSKHLQEMVDVGLLEVEGYPHTYRQNEKAVVEGQIASIYGAEA